MSDSWEIRVDVKFHSGHAEVEFHCDNSSTGEYEVFEVSLPSVTQVQGHDAAVAQAYEALVARLTGIRTEAMRWLQQRR